MRRSFSILFLFVIAIEAVAESKNPADYPLRIHVFRRTQTTFYSHRVADEVKGDGRGNLFENGEARGVDFEFDCSKKLQTSSGFETFPARWRKVKEELIVLMPAFGKDASYSTCRLKVQMKDFAYFSRNGVLSSEPIQAYKDWMTKHNYDPEHGKGTPTITNTATPHAAP